MCEPFPANCTDTARKLPGDWPDDSPDVSRTAAWTAEVITKSFAHPCANFGADSSSASCETFPANCPDTSRMFRGRCVGRHAGCCVEIARTRTGCGHTCGLTADWSWIGRGCGPCAGHTRASARTLPGCCPDNSTDVARMIRRTPRRTPRRMLRGNCAAVARLAALFFNKGMVSNQNTGFPIPESRQRFRSTEHLKLMRP